MGKKWILVIDSGIGGIYTLNKIKQQLPNENYLYYMDVLHAPYGNKSVKNLIRIADEAVKKFIQKFDIKLIVLACNTLSSICYEFLKEKYFSIPIIKISPVLNISYYQNLPTLVIATKNTIKHNKEIKNLKKSANIFFYGFKTLAKKIDKNIFNTMVLLPYLKHKLKKFKNKKVKNIVLGCTHFNYIKNELRLIFGDDVNFLESSENVAKKVEQMLKYSGIKSRKRKIGKTLILRKI